MQILGGFLGFFQRFFVALSTETISTPESWRGATRGYLGQSTKKQSGSTPGGPKENLLLYPCRPREFFFFVRCRSTESTSHRKCCRNSTGWSRSLITLNACSTVTATLPGYPRWL